MELFTHRDILFTINPKSGSKRISHLIRQLNSQYPEIKYLVTKDLNDLDVSLRSNINKYKVFIVVGGDGTVNKALRYVYGREQVLLGVLPMGSGNGFSRELGFRKSLKSLLRDARKGRYLDIDILSINGEMFINTAGLGFDSFVAHIFHNKRGRGLKTYILSTLQSIIFFKPFHAVISIGLEQIEDTFFMITFANTRQFGNNAIISPDSKPDDGVYELITVKPFPKYLYPIFVIRLFSGSLKDSKYIKTFKVKDNVEIRSAYNKYHMDGEPNVFDKVMKIKMLRQKIRIIKTEDYSKNHGL